MSFGSFVKSAGKKIGKLAFEKHDGLKKARKAALHKSAENIGKIINGTESAAGATIGGLGWAAKGTTKAVAKGTKATVKALPRSAVNMVSPLVSKNKNSLLGYRVNALGLGVAATVSAGIGVGSGIKEANKLMAGQSDGQTTPFAPRLPSYSFGEQAGATGDLVFALNNKRRG